MANGQISANNNITMPFTEVDIGGTDTDGGATTGHWVSMEGYETFMAFIELGTFNAADIVDTLKLQQATSSAGAGVKDLLDAGAQSTLGTDGDNAKLEVRASDLDIANDFNFVRVLVGENDNGGVDNVSAVYIRGNPTYAVANKTVTTTSHVPS